MNLERLAVANVAEADPIFDPLRKFAQAPLLSTRYQRKIASTNRSRSFDPQPALRRFMGLIFSLEKTYGRS